MKVLVGFERRGTYDAGMFDALSCYESESESALHRRAVAATGPQLKADPRLLRNDMKRSDRFGHPFESIVRGSSDGIASRKQSVE
jgi:hypothetical protein